MALALRVGVGVRVGGGGGEAEGEMRSGEVGFHHRLQRAEQSPVSTNETCPSERKIMPYCQYIITACTSYAKNFRGTFPSSSTSCYGAIASPPIEFESVTGEILSRG